VEIVPGLHQIKTPMPRPELPYVFAYAFEGADGISLFDSGFGTPEATAALAAGLAALGHEPRAIRRLRRVGGVGFATLQRADIVRHSLVQRIVEAYAGPQTQHTQRDTLLDAHPADHADNKG